MRLSGQKDAALQSKILRNLSKVNELKAGFSHEEFNTAFPSLPTTWNVFLLHCIQPQPIRFLTKRLSGNALH